MSILNPEQMGQALSFVENELNEPQPQTQEQAPAETQTENSVSQQDVKTDESSPPEQIKSGEKEGGHPVPYERFKSVNETKKELAKKVADYERELHDLREKAKRWESPEREAPRTQREEKSVLDDIFNEEPDERYTKLDTRLRTFEEKQAAYELETEIAAASKAFPRVPKEVMLQAVIQNPQADIATVARHYDAWQAEIEQRAIDEYLKRQTPAPVAAPRRPSSQVSGGGTSVLPPTGKMTAAQRSAAALEHLKKSGFFE